MSEVANPHDRFVKEVLGQPATARDFLVNYLPADVVDCFDLSTLEVVKDSFIDPKLAEHLSDLLYQVSLQDNRLGYLYLLFEHRSHVLGCPPLDLVRYGVQIWSRHLAVHYARTLPPIIPLIFYHGRNTWVHPLDFAGLFDLPAALVPYRPSWRYELIDLARWPDEDLKGEVLLRSFLLVTKHIFAEDLGERLPDILILLRDLARSKTGLQYVETLLRYVAAGAPQVEEEAFEAAIETALAAGGITMPTLAERWEQRGLERGMQQGLEQGLEQGQRRTMNALRRSIIDALEARFEAVPAAVLLELDKVEREETLHLLHKRAVVIASLEAFRDLVRRTLAD
ncbi:MAG: Rpn family recombination-promoting nuclease/putative transposase [Thermodesulfobacteriota bacterium]